jgi:hypothetical protein
MGSTHGLEAVLLFSREDRGAADLALTFSGPLMWLWLGRQSKGFSFKACLECTVLSGGDVTSKEKPVRD